MQMRLVLKFKSQLFSPFSKSKPSPPPRIADVLLLHDNEEDRLLQTYGCTGSPNCSKPRRIADRLFFCFNRGKPTNKIHDDRKKGHNAVAPPDHVTGGPDLLPGCCLLHLIAESKNELQKMAELRIQMESVLQTTKEGLLNKDLLGSKNIQSKEGDGVEKSSGFNSNLISNKLLFDQSSKAEDAPKDDCLEGMDRLEAELEVELERLQLLLDSGKFSSNPPEDCKSCSLSHGEVINVEEENCQESHCGVPPYELERKLHELLETRQEQEIRELETALESAKQELREKEREISWWKDTAHLMLEHVRQPSPLNFCEVEMAKAKAKVTGGLTLESVRDSLIRQEDTIVFSLIERARFPANALAYDPSYFSDPGSCGSLVDFAGRYENPEESPFFPDNLPPSQVPPHKFPRLLHPAGRSVNLNKIIWDVYFNKLLPLFVAPGDDGNYASTAAHDLECLQALSRRIHYGKLVAEVKFRGERKDYEPAIRARDKKTLMDLLTDQKVEEAVKRRVAKKAMTFGQEVKLGNDTVGSKGKYKVDPDIVSRLYGEWVIPLTKDVEVEYLLRRLD
ncbi:hypothetical protein V6N11_061558 [Hibiscus sabdariffa]|uniref:chorismate mutase n=1 Tax=Hibiscus sabdariffa TaxID=183260 RepID=A0ABR2NVZ9_9ROSI